MTLADIKRKIKDFERACIVQALDAEGWNQTHTAKRLQCGLSMLRRYIEKHPDISKAAKIKTAKGTPCLAQRVKNKQSK